MCTAQNNMMKKIYEILNCKIEVSADFEWTERENLKPFVSDGEAEFFFELRKGITYNSDDLEYIGEEKWVTEFQNCNTKQWVRKFAWYSDLDAVVLQRNEKCWEVQLSEHHFEQLMKSDMLSLLPLERMINTVSGMMLHSSVVDWNGNGILFTGPSGIGKSTQASLWEKYEDATILNGDRAGIRKKENCFHVYGLPYAGSSNIYINQSVPIKAIVVLEQAEENCISLLRPIDAFSKLYSESTVIPWDKDFVETHSGVIHELVSEVSVYLLQCRPDMEAVTVLKEKIK